MAVRRGEDYFVNLSPAIGREQRGRRPVAVVSSDAVNQRPLVVAIVPGTKGANVHTDYPTNARLPAGEGGLPEETVFLTFQIRAIDHSRFKGASCGVLSASSLAAIERALEFTLALPGALPRLRPPEEALSL